jgi:hypothetical protein
MRQSVKGSESLFFIRNVIRIGHNSPKRSNKSAVNAEASPSFSEVPVFFLLSSPSGHFAAEDVKAKLNELNQKWEALKAKASQRRQDLEDSLQAQQYFADANEAESWMREKEPIVGSTDYGKDEDSAEVISGFRCT